MSDDRLWYKDAVIYELHVRAFFDSTGDGRGDFRGLTARLDYLQDLGVTTLWLLPFYPSPGKDDGYDIADYASVNPDYGTLRDVRAFIREAHRRGLRVVTELVCNHTSDQHPWFQRARRAPAGSAARDFYVWSDTPDRYRDARIIFKDFETSNWSWDAVAGAYYWHRFYAHQPDLNFESAQVREAIFRTMDFWLEMGVDGLRLDAVPYLYEREGTNCENLPETHAYLRDLRRHIDARYGDRMLLAEANQWPEDAAAYFGDGDECHMAFHFPVMPRMFMALRLEDRFPIIDILAQTPQIPDTAQWALFLRNHDELTLEMVTDEERDYMYRVYAHDPQMRINLGIRRRLAPLLGNNRRRIELLNGLLFSLPGTPVLYYGDEIGMGDNVYLGDRNGVRTPMQWSGDRNAGFSAANRQRLYLPVITDPEYHFEAVNVEAQQNNPNSLLWWMKRLIALRKRHRAFSRGTIEFLHPVNRKVLAFVREHEGERILVVANLSRFVQYAELDVSTYAGTAPVEMFGQVEFPAVSERPFFVTLGPHTFYWFLLEPVGQAPVVAPAAPTETATVPQLAAAGLVDLLDGPASAPLMRLLPAYLRERRWFGAKSRRIRQVSLHDAQGVSGRDGIQAALAVLTVDYTEGEPDMYVLPLVLASDEEAERIVREQPQALVTRVAARGDGGPTAVLYDGLYDRRFSRALLDAIRTRRRFRGRAGRVIAEPTAALRGMRPAGDELEPTPIKVEQSNTSVVYGNRLILKVYRRLEPGTNPDLEIGRALTDAGFEHAPPVAGFLAYQPSQGESAALGILQGFVPNEGDAWAYTLDAVGVYYERATASAVEADPPGSSTRMLLELADAEPPTVARETIGDHLDSAWQLGRRTADLHLALAGIPDPAFTPEPFTPLYRRSLYQGMRSQATESLELLRTRMGNLPDEARDLAIAIGVLHPAIQQRFAALLDRRVDATRIRTHGDYHLGQVLYTGRDFVIIDFEGEPGRPMSERRIKRSPLSDVAGMLRSFHYAAFGSLLHPRVGGAVRSEDVTRLEDWAAQWYAYVAASFLRGYLTMVGDASFVPADRETLVVLLDALLLQKALYELRYELNNRPDWVSIPLRGIHHLISERAVAGTVA